MTHIQMHMTRRDLYRMAKDFLARGIITHTQKDVLECLIKRTNVGEGFKGRVSIAEMAKSATRANSTIQRALNGDRPNNRRALLAGGFEPLNLVRREGSGQGADGENEVPLYIFNIEVWKQLYTQPKTHEGGGAG